MKKKLLDVLNNWVAMYPEDMFPPIDYKELHSIFVDEGIPVSIESIYADCARRVINLAIAEVEKITLKSSNYTPYIVDCHYMDQEDGCCNHPSNLTPECNGDICPRVRHDPYCE